MDISQPDRPLRWDHMHWADCCYNRALLKVIKNSQPESISSLAEMTGRKVSNLSRTLKTMSNYGIVEMIRERNHVRPIAKATDFHIVTA